MKGWKATLRWILSIATGIIWYMAPSLLLVVLTGSNQPDSHSVIFTILFYIVSEVPFLLALCFPDKIKIGQRKWIQLSILFSLFLIYTAIIAPFFIIWLMSIPIAETINWFESIGLSLLLNGVLLGTGYLEIQQLLEKVSKKTKT